MSTSAQIPMSWYDAIEPQLPGISREYLDVVLLDVIRTFCMLTDVWTQWLTPVDIVNGTDTYAVTVPTDTTLVRPLLVKIDGSITAPRTRDQINHKWPGYNYDPEIGFTIRPKPNRDINGGLVVFASLMPTKLSAVPSVLATYWQNAIVEGVLAKCRLDTKKPFANPQLAVINRGNFNRGMAEARLQSERSYFPMPTIAIAKPEYL